MYTIIPSLKVYSNDILDGARIILCTKTVRSRFLSLIFLNRSFLNGTASSVNVENDYEFFVDQTSSRTRYLT